MKLFQPKNLILLTAFCLPLYMIKVTFWILPTNLLELLAIFSSLSILFSQRKTCLAKLKNIPKIYLLASCLLLLGATLSIVFNNDWRVGMGILKSWFLIPIIFSVSLFFSLDSEDDLIKLYKTIFFSAGLVALLSLIYKFFHLVTYDGRLAAFYLSPNHLAMYLAPGVMLGSYFIFEKKYNNYLHYVILLLILASLYFTFSIGTWLALLFSFLLLFIIRKNYSPKIIFIFLLASFLLFFSQINSEKVQNIINNSSRSSLASRITIWEVSLRLIEDNTFLGIGPGNFQDSYLSMQPFYPPFLEWAVPQPHNIFLAFWLQTGLIGLLGFLIILWQIFKNSYSLLQKQKSAALATPLFMFFSYTIIHGLIDTPYWKNDLSFLFWIAIVAILFISQFEKNLKNHMR